MIDFSPVIGAAGNTPAPPDILLARAGVASRPNGSIVLCGPTRAGVGLAKSKTVIAVIGREQITADQSSVPVLPDSDRLGSTRLGSPAGIYTSQIVLARSGFREIWIQVKATAAPH